MFILIVIRIFHAAFASALPLLNFPYQYKHHLPIPAIILTLPFNGSKMKSSLLFTDALKLRRPNAFNVMLKPAGPSCNLNCTYCYYLEKSRLYPHSANLKMSDKILENFTRQFIEAHQVPVVTFTWQGGEPSLMGLDFFRKALAYQKQYAGEKKIENSFQTNGTRLNDDWCKFFHDNNFLVGISIDGDEHVHDHYRKTFTGNPSFKRVMKGIDLLHKHSVEFNTLSVVNDYSSKFASETYRFLKKTGRASFSFFRQWSAFRMMQEKPDWLLLLHHGGQSTEWSVRPTDFENFLLPYSMNGYEPMLQGTMFRFDTTQPIMPENPLVCF